jgi:transcriptional regulator with XRE-family HTH domain
MGGARGLRYRLGMATTAPPVGHLVREWRQRRRRSQLDLACDGEISTRHLSFIETGRATPSRQMILRLGEVLDVPLRERNLMLVAAGYAPRFAERPLDDPALDAAREAVRLVLRGHEPYPAVAVDRHWTLVAANAALGPLLDGIDPSLLAPPVNVLRLGLHPLGLAPRIANLPEWRDHLLGRLRRQVADTGDAVLRALDELTRYPATNAHTLNARAPRDYAGVVVPLELVTPLGTLAFFGTVTVFGTPLDVTLSELAVEAFFPADATTAAHLRSLPRPDSA